MMIPPWSWFVLKERLASTQKPPPSAPPPKGVWDVVQLLMPLVTGGVLAWVGWLLTGVVEQGFKREQLQLSQVKEMRDLIATLVGKDVSKESALPTALTLSAYGRPAISPLLTILTESQDEIRLPAAESALRALGLADPDPVCGPLVRILRNQSGRVGWPAYDAAIRLAGDIPCPSAKPALIDLASRLRGGDPAIIGAVFAKQPAFGNAAMDQLRRDVDGSMRSLEVLP
jgi:hypothetical protein